MNMYSKHRKFSFERNCGAVSLGSETWKFGIKQVSSVCPPSERILCDEGLGLETSASISSYGNLVPRVLSFQSPGNEVGLTVEIWPVSTRLIPNFRLTYDCDWEARPGRDISYPINSKSYPSYEYYVNCGHTKEMKKWSSQLWLRFKQSQLSPKNVFGASTGFEPMASALALQCSTNWAMKTHMLGAGQFVCPQFT